jgi:hypothetical protein
MSNHTAAMSGKPHARLKKGAMKSRTNQKSTREKRDVDIMNVGYWKP